MEANEFFKKEKLPEETNFEKVPEGMTFINVSTLDIETTEKDFGDGKKTRYKLKFKNKKGEDKEYEVGIKVIRGIEAALEKQTEYIVLSRQGKGREDTTYTVTAMEE